MDAENKQSFDRWLQRNYPTLYRQLKDTDAFHDAYLTVARLSRVLPAEYLTMMHRAYILNRRLYIQHYFRFVVPDPRFWLFLDEMPDESIFLTHEELMAQEKEREEREQADKRKIDAFAQWVREHYSPSVYVVFRMYYYEKLSIADMSRLLNVPKTELIKIITCMCENYRNNKHKRNQPKNEDKPQASTSTQMTINFRRCKHGHHHITPSASCIRRLGLNKDRLIAFTKIGEKSLYMVTGNECNEHNINLHCLLKKGNHEYDLKGSNAIVVNMVLEMMKAKRSVTLSLKPTQKKNIYVFDLENPVKID